MLSARTCVPVGVGEGARKFASLQVYFLQSEKSFFPVREKTVHKPATLILNSQFSILNYQLSIIIVFRIISLSKSRLAGLYFPESSQAVATNRLMRWVHGCRPLMAELEAAGYSRSQKWLTVRQVALIVAHLGEP